MNLQSAEEYLKSNKKHGEAYEFDSKLNVIPVYDAIMITHKYAKLYATEKVKEALTEMLKRGSYVSAKATHDLEVEIINSINNE